MHTKLNPAGTERRSADPDPRWQAVMARDGAFDGKFVYGVKTTGVYCRPSCPARLAQRENIAVFPSCEAAEKAGLRPCLRCKPKEPALEQRHAALVARICRIIDAADEPASLEALAREAGMSSFHFHRVFRAVTGVTPKA